MNVLRLELIPLPYKYVSPLHSLSWERSGPQFTPLAAGGHITDPSTWWRSSILITQRAGQAVACSQRDIQMTSKSCLHEEETGRAAKLAIIPKVFLLLMPTASLHGLSQLRVSHRIKEGTAIQQNKEKKGGFFFKYDFECGFSYSESTVRISRGHAFELELPMS